MALGSDTAAGAGAASALAMAFGAAWEGWLVGCCGGGVEGVYLWCWQGDGADGVQTNEAYEDAFELHGVGWCG